MKKVAVLQSNYIPWKGYFDIINDVDEFVFYDEVQYTKRDWRNRNKIYTLNGLKWLSVPCQADYHSSIDSVKISTNIDWRKDHYNSIKEAYRKSKFMNDYEDLLRFLYFDNNWEYLSEFNQAVTKYISQKILGINTTFTNSKTYYSHGSKDEKMLSLLKSIGATDYVSGPAAKEYMDIDKYNQAGINVIWKDYSGYPEYSQDREVFEHSVSVLDLLFNVGKNAPQYIWGWR